MCIRDRVYALHALGLALGAFGAASVLGSFLFGWPSIIAVIINYVKRDQARGTWLESHFTWPVSYTHLRAHETVLALVCRLLLEHRHTTRSPPPIPHSSLA